MLSWRPSSTACVIPTDPLGGGQGTRRDCHPPPLPPRQRWPRSRFLGEAAAFPRCEARALAGPNPAARTSRSLSGLVFRCRAVCSLPN